MKSQHYRADIDGLRALAIIPVVLFHAGIVGFSGGFVGVDIFFVISGYLITSIILREIREGTFSLLTFYERRMRRIVPALSLVLFVVFILSFIIIRYPQDFTNLGQSLFAQSVFLANIFFMRQDGYFAAPADTMPLLHTWTLSVEEQFYIIFPILLLLLFRYVRSFVVHILLFLIALSFAYNLLLVVQSPGEAYSLPFLPDIWRATNATAGFYLLLTRAWELIAGALLAISAITIPKYGCAEATSVMGLGAIIYSIVIFDASTPFPGSAALLPVLGSAAILVSNANHVTFTGKILSFPTFVWIGLISYPLYLWHWPVFVLGKIATLGTGIVVDYRVLILFSVLLAWLTYRFVETPFRKKRVLSSRKSMLIAGTCVISFFLSIGLLVQFSDIFERDIPTKAQVILMAAEPKNLSEMCSVDKNTQSSVPGMPCMLGADSNDIQPTFLLWGDSHAQAIVPAINRRAKELGVKGALIRSGGCAPIPQTKQIPTSAECSDTLDLAMEYIRDNNIRYILLVARWNIYIYGTPNGTRELITDSDTTNKNPIDSERVFRQHMQNLIDLMKDEGRTVYLTKQVPHQYMSITSRESFYYVIRTGNERNLRNNQYLNHLKENAYVNSVFEALDSKYDNVNIIDPAKILCSNDSECIQTSNGLILYADDNHLNFSGSLYVQSVFETFFSDLLKY